MPLSKSLQTYLNNLEDRPAKFVSAIEKKQIRLLTRIVVLINKLDTENGKIITSVGNFSKVASIKFQISQAVKNLMASDIKSFGVNLDKQIAETNALYSGFGFKGKKIYTTVYESAKKNVLSSLTEVEAVFINPLTQIVNGNIASGSDLEAAIDTLTDFVVGTDKVDGKLIRYVKTVATDAHNNTTREYSRVIAKDLKIKKFLYTGGIVEHTREFCEHRNGGEFTEAQIRAWGELGDWQGKRPETNADNIFTLAGGYNCAHAFIPIG